MKTSEEPKKTERQLPAAAGVEIYVRPVRGGLMLQQGCGRHCDFIEIESLEQLKQVVAALLDWAMKIDWSSNPN